jgi:hypothetical protein
VVAKYKDRPSAETKGDKSLSEEFRPLKLTGADHAEKIGAETAGSTPTVKYNATTGQTFAFAVLRNLTMFSNMEAV